MVLMSSVSLQRVPVPPPPRPCLRTSRISFQLHSCTPAGAPRGQGGPGTGPHLGLSLYFTLWSTKKEIVLGRNVVYKGGMYTQRSKVCRVFRGVKHMCRGEVCSGVRCVEEQGVHRDGILYMQG